MTTPAKIDAYARTVDLEHVADVAALKQKVISTSAGQGRVHVGRPSTSRATPRPNTAQIVMFIGGHPANADPTASITSFTQQFHGARWSVRARWVARRRASRTGPETNQRGHVRLVRQRQLR